MKLGLSPYVINNVIKSWRKSGVPGHIYEQYFRTRRANIPMAGYSHSKINQAILYGKYLKIKINKHDLEKRLHLYNIRTIIIQINNLYQLSQRTQIRYTLWKYYPRLKLFIAVDKNIRQDLPLPDPAFIRGPEIDLKSFFKNVFSIIEICKGSGCPQSQDRQKRHIYNFRWCCFLSGVVLQATFYYRLLPISRTKLEDNLIII